MQKSMMEILTVSELNNQIRGLLETGFDLIWVEGEVSNLRRPASGHLYFTLKDDKSQIRAVLFKPSGSRLLRGGHAPVFELEEGMQIISRGRLAVYAPRGEYQLVVDSLEPRGAGALQKAYEQLKARLQAEGLFDASRKKPIPYLPRRVGVITSPTGAVIRDILNVTGRRFPSVALVVAPVRVQGPESPGEIIRAIRNLHHHGGIDVLILARGGGSLEDLMPFNDERVIRAIANSSIPVISAVGHETDFTLADLAADLRAPTPSAAAELAVPNRKDLISRLAGIQAGLMHRCSRHLARNREKLFHLAERLKDPNRLISGFRLALDDRWERCRMVGQRKLTGEKQTLLLYRARLRQAGPLRRIQDSRQAVANLETRLNSAWILKLEQVRRNWTLSTALLDSLSPLAVLQRGYGIVRSLPEGTIVRDAAALSAGDFLEIQLLKGRMEAEVTRILPEERHGKGKI